MTVLAIVPARGGSRGLPGKNLLQVGGQSLVARAVRAGVDSGAVDVVLVSSDDDAILAEGERAGAVAQRRPDELATDDAGTIDVVRHHLSAFPDADVVVLLQPTSPLRTAEDVGACVAALEDAPAAVSVVPGHPWQWSVQLGPARRLEPVAGWSPFTQRRQQLGAAYSLNGAVYAARRSWLEQTRSFIADETVGVVMPVDRSVDVDSADDLELAQMLWSRGQGGASYAAQVLANAVVEPRPWVLLGGGGHARSVADALMRSGHTVAAVVDPAPDSEWPCPILGSDAEGLALARSEGLGVLPAVGSNELRLRIISDAVGQDVELPAFVAASATAADSATLGEGTVLLEHAHVGPASRVGKAVVVNTAAVVEHDVRIGDGTHVAPGSVVLGGATIGTGCLVGAGATVLPSVRVGDGAVVGAGSVVLSDVEAGATVVGVYGKGGRG